MMLARCPASSARRHARSAAASVKNVRRRYFPAGVLDDEDEAAADLHGVVGLVGVVSQSLRWEVAP